MSSLMLGLERMVALFLFIRLPAPILPKATVSGRLSHVRYVIRLDGEA